MTIQFSPEIPLAAVRLAAEHIGCRLENAGSGDVIIAPNPDRARGDCDLCGNWDGALVLGACRVCRDSFNLPGQPA